MSWLDQERQKRSEKTRKANPGTHRVVLDKVEMFDTRDYGKALKATFRIKETGTDAVGAECGDVWYINASGWSGKYNRNDAAEFVAAICASLGHGRDKMQQVNDEILHPTQPARGVELVMTATEGRNKKNEPVTNCSYEPVEATVESMREGIEFLGQVKMTATPPPPPPTSPPASAPAPIAPTGGLLGSLFKK